VLKSYSVGAVDSDHHILVVVAAAWSSLLIMLPSPVWIMAISSEALCSVLSPKNGNSGVS